MSSYWYYLKGLFHEKFKKNEERAVYYYAKSDNGNNEIVKKIADFYYDKKRWKEAAPFLRKVVDSDSSNGKNLKKLLDCYNKTKDAKGTVYVYSKLAKNGSNDSELLYKYGLALEKEGKKAEAIEKYKKAIEINPNDLKILKKYQECNQEGNLWIKTAKERLKEQKSYQALTAFEKALEYFPERGDLWESYADCLNDRYREQEAESAYKKSISKGNINKEIFYKLGELLEKEHKNNEAQEQYKIACNFFNVNSKYGSARLHDTKGKWNKATDAYCEYQKNNNDSSKDFLSKYGRSLDYCYRFQEAEYYLKDLNVDDLRNLDDVKRLVTIYIRLSKYNEAIDLMTKLFDRYKDIYIVLCLAVCYFRMGAFEKACEIILCSRQTIEEGVSKNDAVLAYFEQCGTDLNIIFDKFQDLMSAGEYELAFNQFLEVNNLIILFPYKITSKAFNEWGNLLRNHLYLLYQRELPINDNFVLFESFQGDTISCNPYAIFKYLYNCSEYKALNYVWVVNDEEVIPPSMKGKNNIFFVKRNSPDYIKFLATSKYLINNNIFPDYFFKREGQIYCNTWHGTPLKSLGDLNKFNLYGYGNVSRNFLHADWLIHSNKFTESIMLDRYHVRHILPGQSVVTGYPRQDLLLNITDEEKREIRKLVVGNDERPILLYAPTWRDYLSEEQQKEKFEKVLRSFDNQKFNIVFKGHHTLESFFRNTGFPTAPNWIDTNELLSIVDVLVTDYSSIGVDFSVTKKPVFYLVDDIEEYEEKRGLLVILGQFPGVCCKSLDELCEKINSIGCELNFTYKNNDFIKFDDGLATQRVVNFIFKQKPSPIEYDKPSLLFYVGPLFNNGIGSALINLIKNISNLFNIYLLTDRGALLREENCLDMTPILDKVHVIPRSGGFVNNFEEDWIFRKWWGDNAVYSECFEDYLHNIFKREFYRLFPNPRFKVNINYEGYNRSFSGIMSAAPNNVIYLHNDMLGELEQRFNYLSIIFGLYKYYQKLVSVTESINIVNLNNLSDAYRVDKQKFTYAGNLIDIDRIKKMAEEPVDKKYFKKGPVFITLGRLSPEKDHIKLIKAFSEVVKVNKNAQLLIAGDGFLKDELSVLIDSLNLRSNVYLLGLLSNPFPYLKKADCFVLSSNYEGLGMVLLEAIIFNRPIISTNIPAVRKILKDTGAILVDNSVKALSAAMINFCSKPFSNTYFDFTKYNSKNCEKFLELIG